MTPANACTRFLKAAKLGAALAFARRQGIGGACAPLYLDVGARGGLPRAWHVAAKLGVIRPVFVEPDRAEADRLAGAYPGVTVVPCALGARSETRELNLTKDRGLSSLLCPDYTAIAALSRLEPWAIEQVVTVDVVRLDEIWNRYSQVPPHYIKIDVQGFEKEVLNGMGNLLDNVLCLEFEAHSRPLIWVNRVSRAFRTTRSAWIRSR